MRRAQQTILTDRVQVDEISLRQFGQIWQDYGHHWQGAGPFMTPAWLQAWSDCLGRQDNLVLLQVESDLEIIGIAPLLVKDQTVRLIGSEDVCDHLDFLVTPEQADTFYRAILGYLGNAEIKELVLQPVLPSSSVLENLVPYARSNGYEVEITRNNVYLNMNLPTNWQTYLAGLDKKQRHEVRRKFRRFLEAGKIRTRNITEPAETLAAMDTFFYLFRLSRTDKDNFMVAKRQHFFQELATNLAKSGMLDLLEVSIDGEPMAMSFCFDYGSTTYLYNNGFNPAYRSVSPGIVSKVMSIRRSIEKGKEFFNFLNGDERYKYQLGGSEESLFACRITLAQ